MSIDIRDYRDERFILDRVVERNGCWEWQGARTSRGYGHFGVCIDGKQRHFKAHRAAFLIFTGNDPSGLEVMHACDNTRCCNPDHLTLGTHAENMADMKRKGRAVGAPGPLNHSTKLTAADVQSIRKAKGYGAIAAIARSLGISPTHASRVRSERHWTDEREIGGVS